MYKFFKDNKKWGVPGAVFIVFGIFCQVMISVEINEWYGLFYGQIQDSLSKPNSVALGSFYSTLLQFCLLAGMWVVISTIVKFFSSHWTFRWRNSMVNQYHKNFSENKIEGSSQRVQEDTLKFTRLTEDLGQNLAEAAITLIMFFPILYKLGENIAEKSGQHALIYTAIAAALGGTLLLAFIGKKLPGLEYDIQVEEAAYRKKLVKMENEELTWRADLATVEYLYEQVRKVHYRSYFHYLYFNLTRYSYMQGMVIVPYVVMAPSIVAGLLTLGVVRQIGHSFTQVSSNLQYLVQSWPQIVELMSVHKRLKEYDKLCQQQQS
jgi:peptide/bleomycin uptake transporter